jgi:hypothetical protein
MKKSQHGLNYLHDDIWTNENLTSGIWNDFLWKINFIEIWFQPSIMIIQIYMYFYCDMAYWLDYGIF